jgi:hypothetical protein
VSPSVHCSPPTSNRPSARCHQAHTTLQLGHFDVTQIVRSRILAFVLSFNSPRRRVCPFSYRSEAALGDLKTALCVWIANKVRSLVRAREEALALEFPQIVCQRH